MCIWRPKKGGPKRGIQGSKNLNLIIFYYFVPKWTKRSKKINFNKKILRELLFVTYGTTLSVEAVTTMIGCLPTQAIAFEWKPGLSLVRCSSHSSYMRCIDKQAAALSPAFTLLSRSQTCCELVCDRDGIIDAQLLRKKIKVKMDESWFSAPNAWARHAHFWPYAAKALDTCDFCKLNFTAIKTTDFVDNTVTVLKIASLE